MGCPLPPNSFSACYPCFSLLGFRQLLNAQVCAFCSVVSVSPAPMRRPAGQPVRVTSVSPVPMRRPAGRPVRSSADHAWCASALEALQQACRAFELRYGAELQREFGLVVHCTYKHETASQRGAAKPNFCASRSAVQQHRSRHHIPCAASIHSTIAESSSTGS